MMGDLDPEYSSQLQTRKLDKVWSKYKNEKGKLRLCKAVLRTYWVLYFLSVLMVVISSISEMLSPFFLYSLLEFLQDENDHQYSRGYLLMAGILGCQYILFMFQ